MELEVFILVCVSLHEVLDIVQVRVFLVEIIDSKIGITRCLEVVDSSNLG